VPALAGPGRAAAPTIEALASRRSVFTRYDDIWPGISTCARCRTSTKRSSTSWSPTTSRRCSRSCAPRRSPGCPSTPRSGRDQGNRPGCLRVRPGGPNATVEVNRNQTV